MATVFFNRTGMHMINSLLHNQNMDVDRFAKINRTLIWQEIPNEISRLEIVI
jgi:hypothetical protein